MKPQFHRNLYLFDGRLSQRIWARGIVTDYSYDGWGSLTNTVYSDGTPTVTLFYDAMGRQTNAVDAAGVTTFRYDDSGSLTNEALIGAAGENTIIRHWDSFGRTAGYTLNNVRQTTIGYDPATGRIATMLANGSNVPFTWSYLPGSDLKSSLAYPNGLTALWTYDANGQLLQVRNATSTDVISQYDYTYDAAGRRIEIARSGTAMSESRTDAYGYNVRNELTSATKTGGPQSPAAEYAYQYDDIGNRITSTDLTTNRTYTANSLNQYSAITTSDFGLQTSSFEPQFDDDGNQTLIQTATGVWSVQYNGENRPVLWTGGTQSAATNIVMSFDRMGRRVEYLETVDGGAAVSTSRHHRFVYDGYLCVQRLDASAGNAVDLVFVWDAFEKVATRPLMIEKPGSYRMHVTHDGNKNVSELVFFSGGSGMAAHYEYAPFGAVTVSTRDTSVTDYDFRTYNPFRFSSEYADDTLGLVYYNYRHNNPLDGRWMSRDLKFEFATNEDNAEIHYVFCGNNPICHSDSLGKEFFAKCNGHGDGIIGWSYTFDEIGRGFSLMSDTAIYALIGLDYGIRWSASVVWDVSREVWEFPSKTVAYSLAGVSMIMGASHRRMTFRNLKGKLRNVDLYTGGYLMPSNWGMTPSSTTIFVGENFYLGIQQNSCLAMDTLKHECGHIIQAEILGPLYLPSVVPFTGWSYRKSPFSWAEDWADGFINKVSDININSK